MMIFSDDIRLKTGVVIHDVLIEDRGSKLWARIPDVPSDHAEDGSFTMVVELSKLCPDHEVERLEELSARLRQELHSLKAYAGQA